MLASLHALILTLAGCRVLVLVAVRGQCLGGGLEIGAGRRADLRGAECAVRPAEIKLGVFAPAASCLLPVAASGRWRRKTCCAAAAQHRCRAGAPPSAWCRCWLTIRSPPRWPISTSTSHRAAPRRWRMPCRPRAHRARRTARRTGARGAPVPAKPDEDPRRQRGPGGLPRQALTHLGAPLMSTTLPEVTCIVQRCEALFEDLNFEAVKEWKAAVPGRKAVGYMPVYVPARADPRRRHAAGGHPRRRRPDRGDPGRRLLPELICRIRARPSSWA